MTNQYVLIFHVYVGCYKVLNGTFVSALVVRKLVREDDLVQFFFVLSFEEDVATPYGFACTVAQLFIRSTFKPKGFQTPVDLFASKLTI